MDKSIIISESVKAYFSSHTSLAAVGRKIKKLKVFEPVEQKVKIAQKVVKYRPAAGCFHHPVVWGSGYGRSEQALESGHRVAAIVWAEGMR